MTNMNYEETYEVLDLLDKYTDLNNKIKSFDQTEDRILEILQEYQKDPSKNEDLNCSILDELEPEKLQALVKIFTKASASLAPLKKAAKAETEKVKSSIAEKVLNLCKQKGDSSLTMKFDGFGSIKVIEDEIFTFDAEAEELPEIIESLFDLGLSDFLKIDEKQYLIFAKQYKADNDSYLPGVNSHIELVPKIIGRKTKE